MAMWASVNVYLLAEFVTHGGHMKLMVREVTLLAVYMAGSVQWRVTRLLTEFVP